MTLIPPTARRGRIATSRGNGNQIDWKDVSEIPEIDELAGGLSLSAWLDNAVSQSIGTTPSGLLPRTVSGFNNYLVIVTGVILIPAGVGAVTTINFNGTIEGAGQALTNNASGTTTIPVALSVIVGGAGTGSQVISAYMNVTSGTATVTINQVIVGIN